MFPSEIASVSFLLVLSTPLTSGLLDKVETSSDNATLSEQVANLALAEQVTKLATELSTLKDEVVAVESELKMTSNQLFAANAQISVLQAENTRLQGLLNTTEKKMDDRVNFLSGEINSTKAKLGQTKRPNVKFQVRFSTNQTGIKNGDKLKFDTVMHNDGGGYDDTSGLFKCPVPGTYIFWANLLMDSSWSRLDIYLYKNGMVLAEGYAQTPSSFSHENAALITVTDLQVGDKVWIAKNTGTENTIDGKLYSGFGGVLI